VSDDAAQQGQQAVPPEQMIEVGDLIAVYTARDEQGRKDLAVAEATILGLRRELAQAHEILAVLSGQVEAQNILDGATATAGDVIDVDPNASRAVRRAAKRAPARKAPAKKTARRR
jgi:hypothetical protein